MIGEICEQKNNNSNYGLYVLGGGTVSTVDGALTISALGGGTGTASGGHGVYVTATGGSIRTTGAGALDITATGGAGSSGNNDGVVLYVGNSFQTTGTGNITVRGTKGSGAGSYGIYDNAANAIITSGSSGNSTLLSDEFILTNPGAGLYDVSAVGSLTIAPLTSGTTMGVGSGAGTLSFSDSYIGYTTAAS